jgi:hypothetical protein
LFLLRRGKKKKVYGGHFSSLHRICSAEYSKYEVTSFCTNRKYHIRSTVASIFIFNCIYQGNFSKKKTTYHICWLNSSIRKLVYSVFLSLNLFDCWKHDLIAKYWQDAIQIYFCFIHRTTGKSCVLNETYEFHII